MDADQFVRDHYTWAFAVSALGALIVAATAVLSYRHTRWVHKKTDIAMLRPLIEELRRDGVMMEAASIVEATRIDPWAVLSDARDASCAILRRLGRFAREVDNPRAWEASLDGAEYAVLTEFVDRSLPLILSLRLTALKIDGPDRPYNGDKGDCAGAILNALGRRLRVTISYGPQPWFAW